MFEFDKQVKAFLPWENWLTSSPLMSLVTLGTEDAALSHPLEQKQLHHRMHSIIMEPLAISRNVQTPYGKHHMGNHGPEIFDWMRWKLSTIADVVPLLKLVMDCAFIQLWATVWIRNTKAIQTFNASFCANDVIFWKRICMLQHVIAKMDVIAEHSLLVYS